MAPYSGARVASVTPNSPADLTGLQTGDIILRFDGKEVSDIHAFLSTIHSTRIGKSIDVVVLREGKELAFKVTLSRSYADSSR